MSGSNPNPCCTSARSANQPLVAQMRHQAERQRELLDRPEFAEGVKAFMEKHAPVFRRP